MNKPLSITAITAAALLAACATSTTPPPALIGARSAVQSAAADEQVLRHAPLELKKAGDALRRADELNADGRSLAEVESASYVATRQAEAARAIAQARANEVSIKAAEVDRERVRADARAAEAQRAEARAAAARAEAGQARVAAAVAQGEAARAQQQADAAQASASQAQQQAATLQQQAATLQQQTMTLQQQLAELQARQTDRGMLVTLGDLLFEFGRADIKPGAHEALRKLAAFLQEHPERRLLIEGHTDSVGSDAANLSLSQRRADAVAAALAALGVSPARIGTRGYGESYPVAENNTDTNRALNRRVEVYISDGDRPVRARG